MILRVLILLATLGLLPATAPAQDRASVEAGFRNWLVQEIWPRAKAQGVSRATFDAAFDGVTLDWSLPDLVPPGSAPAVPRRQHQAEFAAPARYFDRNTVAGVESTGRRMADRHAGQLAAIERETGVPGHIILAIWGRESAFGRARIPHDAFVVLGTKGFMSTRADFFTEELIAALRIVEAGQTPPRGMKSSWAGALGQPQFLPSTFLAYAADGDGDGRADIWGSEADTLASIGHFLARHGWVRGRDWGFEVTVPASVSCALEGPDQGRPIRDWEAMGITRVSGRPFPEPEHGAEGFLLMPAGRFGPAFVVTPNFYVLKDYNMSDLYALFVGHVGDRIRYGVADFAASWDPVGGLTRADVTAIQSALVGMGHDVGGVDGLPGYKTRRSIGRWQAATGQRPTCFPEAGTASSLAR
ncbi:lytic murein transglycosylase [Tropicimonas sp. IMCC6043]|uniref:lytic murein transglycosylase n=1 Tax=Tropicimonas sp. IMCC6043 TaxID=2510645 RepID=UPI00101CD1D2|nr:lytic murein transglycosylase [Tropicimonas sp. IMCC6043]RYH09231.1 lytic murein transglycosylase [Tropicimonas sp. IMCC6043]